MNSLSAPSPGEHIVDIHGVPQHYHVAGSGPVCIAHPGGPGVGWEYLRMPLLEDFLTMVYVEPVGTGKSGRLPQHPRGYTIDRYVAHLDGIVEDIGQGGVILLGQSYAGLIAQKYALTCPEKLRGLILYSPRRRMETTSTPKLSAIFRSFSVRIRTRPISMTSSRRTCRATGVAPVLMTTRP